MSVLPAQELDKLKICTPHHERFLTQYGMTAGQGPCTYDVRLKQDLWMWPGRFALASTIEQFAMPNDVCAQVMDKSTWARRGICVQNTFIDPGWQGYLTLEITNHSWRVHKLRAGMPICQILFSRLETPTDRPYAGKYQFQADRPVEPIKEWRQAYEPSSLRDPVPPNIRGLSPLGLPPATAPMPAVKPTKGKRPVMDTPIDCPQCGGSGRDKEARCDLCDGWGVVQG